MKGLKEGVRELLLHRVEKRAPQPAGSVRAGHSRRAAEAAPDGLRSGPARLGPARPAIVRPDGDDSDLPNRRRRAGAPEVPAPFILSPSLAGGAGGHPFPLPRPLAQSPAGRRMTVRPMQYTVRARSGRAG